MKGRYPLPAEDFLGLAAKNLGAIMNYKEQGKVVFHGAPVAQKAGYTICDVDSNEELQSSYSQLRLFPFIETEIIPLISAEQALESIKQSLAAMRASKN
jgi:muconolactone delta-isomerase